MIAAIDTVCREALTVREALRSLRLHRIATTSLPHRGHVSRHGYLKQFEGNVFYLVMGYFISYLPYALLAKAVSSGIIPGVDAPIGGPVLLPAAAPGEHLPTMTSFFRQISLLAVMSPEPTAL